MSNNKNRTVYFLSAVTVRTSDSVLAPATTFKRGDMLEITPDILALNADRNGNTIFDLSDVEQIEKFGEELFRDGSTPDDVNAWDGDSFLRDHHREQLTHLAIEIPDPVERAEALHAIRSKFGYKNVQSTVEYPNEFR